MNQDQPRIRAQAIDTWDAKVNAAHTAGDFAFTEREEEALQHAGRLEFVRRSKAGAVAYVALAIVLALLTPFGTRYPVESCLIVGFYLVLGAVRMTLALIYEDLDAARRRRVDPLLVLTSLGAGALWGLLTGFTLWRFGLTYTTFLLVVCTAGIMAGAMTTLCIRYSLQLIYVIQMLGPAVIAGFTLPGTEGVAMSFIFLIYMLFLVIQGLHLNRAYWLSTRRSLEVEIARLEAEEASRAKSEFLANMSHEIRTPMNGILGITEMALACDVSKSQHRHLSLVRRSAESLMGVIDGILDFSKIEAGMLELNPVPFGLREVLDEVMQTLGPPAGARGLALTLEVGPDVPDPLIGDDGRLRQILLNLVGNAVKFTESGSVRVRALAREEQGGRAELEFQIADTGIGIPRERREAIFQAFAQADSSTTRHFGGTGLGLSISASLVDLLQGRIWLESEEGVGSTFFFTALFERHPGAQVAAPEVASPEGKGSEGDASEGAARELAVCQTPVNEPFGSMSVLLVEDNPVNVLVARRLLERLGCRVTAVGNGRLAVAAHASERYDLIFMDIQMPEMDGVQAACAIRSRERGGEAHTPIIALTAHALQADRDRCRAAGMDGFVTKPVAAQPLRDEVARVLAAQIPAANRKAG